jgi:hypothetical protein
MLSKLLSETSKEENIDDPLDEKNQETSSPYGKALQGGSEKVKLNLEGQLETTVFEKGTLVTLTVGDRAVFSKFISK